MAASLLAVDRKHSGRISARPFHACSLCLADASEKDLGSASKVNARRTEGASRCSVRSRAPRMMGARVVGMKPSASASYRRALLESTALDRLVSTIALTTRDSCGDSASNCSHSLFTTCVNGQVAWMRVAVEVAMSQQLYHEALSRDPSEIFPIDTHLFELLDVVDLHSGHKLHGEYARRRDIQIHFWNLDPRAPFEILLEALRILPLICVVDLLVDDRRI
mmetsp:Transcript_35628/g.78312  ORF Transcript_35628/g.78312 Transcript_35628/m.78312 type:complete len:221 (+) Transcript_35628:611-1273(+)